MEEDEEEETTDEEDSEKDEDEDAKVEEDDEEKKSKKTVDKTVWDWVLVNENKPLWTKKCVTSVWYFWWVGWLWFNGTKVSALGHYLKEDKKGFKQTNWYITSNQKHKKLLELVALNDSLLENEVGLFY